MHEVLVNRLGGLRLPRKSVVRLTDRPDITLDVYRGRKTTIRQLYRAVSQREGEREEKIEERKNVQTTPTRTYCKRNRPLSYYHPNCRTPRHWRFPKVGWLVVFGLNDPLRQYFSLYQVVSQREGERKEKGKMRVKMSKQPPPAPTASAVGP